MSGLIVKIDPDDLSIEPVARLTIVIMIMVMRNIAMLSNGRIGTACNDQHEEAKCGRPLGMAFTKVKSGDQGQLKSKCSLSIKVPILQFFFV